MSGLPAGANGPALTVALARRSGAGRIRIDARNAGDILAAASSRENTVEYRVLGEVMWLLAGSVLVVAVLRRVNLPPILGYLVVGVTLGPSALGLVESVEDTRLIAEFGVVFLLFTLGLEFSLPRMMVMRAEVFLLGNAQVLLTALVAGTAAWLWGLDRGAAIVVGGAMAMSSTAIVIKQLSEQLEVGQTHGRLAVGVLLFQDLAIVPFLVLIPVLSDAGATFAFADAMVAVAKGVVTVIVVILAGRFLLRPLFHEIGRARIAELSTLAVLLVVLGAAGATHAAGLSFALGAFLAGMMLAETEYRHQVETDIRPFRDVLLGLFFITVGMLVDFRRLYEQFALISMLVVMLVLGKAALTTLLSRKLAGNWHDACRSALVTAQGGEFGLALLTLALQFEVVPPSAGEPLLAAIVVSMALSPLVVRHNSKLAALLFGNDDGQEPITDDMIVKSVAAREHVLICGFGRVGQNIARILSDENHEYIALDLDPYRVRSARQAGDPVYFGDAGRPDILAAVGLENASIVVVSFSDPLVALGIVRSVRRRMQDVPILVRSRDDSYLDELQASGATAVIPETLEASLILVSHVLALLDVPESRISERLQDIRDHRYSVLRNLFRREDARRIDDTHALREELKSVSLPEGAKAVGRRLGELKLGDAGISVTALRREGIVGELPAAETELKPGDVLVLYGTPEALAKAETLLLSG